MNPFSSYSTEEMNSVLRMEREVGATFERERCAKIAKLIVDDPKYAQVNFACGTLGNFVAARIREADNASR